MNHAYRKKPVQIEAFQMTLERRRSNIDWPSWLHEAWNVPKDQRGSLQPSDRGGEKLEIFTLEGIHQVDWNDWIIRGVQGELYPCKPEIFAVTYDAVEGAQ